MPWKPADAFKEIARGDQNAEDFLSVFYCWAHMRDDLVDKDKVVAPETAAGLDFTLLHTFSKNRFFEQHKDFLLPVLMTGALAWIASEDRKNHPDLLERLAAQVLKSQYVDVFLAVSFLVGNFDHAVRMSRKYREFSFDSEPIKRLDNPTVLGQTG
jgi:hypothetical protein